MDVNNSKLSLKRVEISLNNFNAIAIPHHIDLLNKHKTNISKFQNLGDLERIRNEQINATRIVVQLRHLLGEMEVLRQRVTDTDLDKFDRLTEKSRQLTMKAIKEYIDMPQYSQSQSSPSLSSGYSSHSPNTSNDRKSIDHFDFTPGSEQEKLTLQIDQEQLSEQQIRQRESCLKSWETLQDEVQDLNEIFIKFQQVIDTQKDTVSTIDKNVETVALNVETGIATLAHAERLKTVWYPLVGAVIGGCIAGPIGLVTGLKVGGLAILSGTALGFTGGRILKKKKEDSYTPSTDGVVSSVSESDKKED